MNGGSWAARFATRPALTGAETREWSQRTVVDGRRASRRVRRPLARRAVVQADERQSLYGAPGDVSGGTAKRRRLERVTETRGSGWEVRHPANAAPGGSVQRRERQ
jgi:hypothetical protein